MTVSFNFSFILHNLIKHPANKYMPKIISTGANIRVFPNIVIEMITKTTEMIIPVQYIAFLKLEDCS